MTKPITRKRRTREHIIADLSVNFVERQVLLCGHTVERVFHDYGYDLFLFTFDGNGEPEAGEIRVQVNASDRLAGSSMKEVRVIAYAEEHEPETLRLTADSQHGVRPPC